MEPDETQIKSELVIVKLTPDECNALVNLIEEAVKSKGLPAAVAAVPLFQRIQTAYNDHQKQANVSR